MCLAGCPLLNGKLIACAHTYGVFNLPVVQPSVRCASCSIICVCRASWAAPWHAPPTVIPPPPSSFSPSEPMPPFRACSLSSARSSLFKSKLAGWQERGRDRKGEWARQQREHRHTGVIVVIFSQPRIGTLSAATTISHRPRSSSSSRDPHRRLVPHPLRANYRVLLGVEVRWRNSGWTWQPTVRERKQC